jgi:hypothetical protein
VRTTSRLALALLLPAAMLDAQAPAPSTAVQPILSLRGRVEGWDWFDASDSGRYAFVGSILRFGATQQLPRIGWRIELAAPVLLGLPDDAVAPAPRGQLGLGATYLAANDGDENAIGLFPKQAFVRLGPPPGTRGHSLRVGRFEFADGGEYTPRQPTLAALKRERIAHRLLGPFTFTHVGRSLDGAHYSFDSPTANITLLGALPTRGAFDVEGLSSLDVRVGYGAVTRAFDWPGGSGEWRLFALLYDDGRPTLKTDNRAAPVRLDDRESITLTTLGAHYLHSFGVGRTEVDLLLWGALQTGDWGVQSHGANAFAAELGVQPPPSPLRPWLRVGYYRGSGDDAPGDDDHETFFQVLPTARIYARFPFYNLMNLEDSFVSLALRGARVTVRGDVRRLRLTERGDLWYSGGGAFERESFGFAGRPSTGRRDLATVVDLGADVRLTPRLTASGYAALAAGGSIIERTYPGGGDGRFLYLELEYRR